MEQTHLSRSGRAVATPQDDCRLILNATEGRVQLLVARLEGGRAAPVLCAQDWHAPSQGAELLAPVLANALERLKLSPAALRRIACVRGPGSFTGLRLALASASGLARATGALMAGIDYLPLLAHSAVRRLAALPAIPAFSSPEQTHFSGAQCRIWVLTHARKNLLHMQGFSACLMQQDAASFPEYAPFPVALADIAVCSPEEAAAVISADSAQRALKNIPEACPPLLLGSGLTRNAVAFRAAFAAHEPLREQQSACAPQPPVLLPSEYDRPSPESLLDYAAALEHGQEDIEPLYVRSSDAEDNLERIAASLGLEPLEARNSLRTLMSARP